MGILKWEMEDTYVRVCERVKEKEKERERVCVCVCEGERERNQRTVADQILVYEYVRELERERT